MMALTSHNEFIDEITEFDVFGKNTIMTPFEWEVDGRKGLTMKAVNEYWTSSQRQANSLHEISYRACFKPQLPEFFICRLTEPGDGVYDPFMGRGTTPLQARLMGRRPLGNDINPLSKVLLAPRLNPPTIEQITERLDSIDLSRATEIYADLLHFYHKDTLCEIIALKEYLLEREKKERETSRHRSGRKTRRTQRQRDRQTNKQTNKQTNSLADKQSDGQGDSSGTCPQMFSIYRFQPLAFAYQDGKRKKMVDLAQPSTTRSVQSLNAVVVHIGRVLPGLGFQYFGPVSPLRVAYCRQNLESGFPHSPTL